MTVVFLTVPWDRLSRLITKWLNRTLTQSLNDSLPYHSPALTSLRILRFIRSRFRALMWLIYNFPLR